MADEQRQGTHNVGADPLTASPGAGRGGEQKDVIPEQAGSAESMKGSEHPVQAESQEGRAAAVQDSPGHVGSPDEMSEESQKGHP